MYQQYIDNPNTPQEWRIHHLDNFLQKKLHASYGSDVYARIDIARLLLNNREFYISAFEHIVNIDVLSKHNTQNYSTT